MSKADKRVKRELIKALEDGLQPDGIRLNIRRDHGAAYLRAEGSGWLFSRVGSTARYRASPDIQSEHTNRTPLYTTAEGMRALRRLKHPRWFWFTENWFPALVAFATIGASAAGAGASIYEALN